MGCSPSKLTEKDCAKINADALETLRALKQICLAADLPVDMLPLVRAVVGDSASAFEIHRMNEEREAEDQRAREAGFAPDLDLSIAATGLGRLMGARSARVRHTVGYPSPFSSPDRLPLVLRAYDANGDLRKLKHGETATIVAMAQVQAYAPDELVIVENPGRWLIESIRIGNREQLAGDPVSGELFVGRNLGGGARFDVVQAAMDVRVRVRYVGGVADGEAFRGHFLGDAV